MTDGEINLVLIGAAGTGGVWFVLDSIKMIFITLLDWRKHVKEERVKNEIQRAFDRRPETLASFKRLKVETEEILRELGWKEVMFKFSV